MADTLIVGDLHGRFEIVKKALDSGYSCVFIGDYLDSFDRSIPDQINTLMMILEAVEEDPEKYTMLLGNHELSYLDDTMRATGYKRATEYHLLHGLASRLRKHAKPYVWVGQYLISHAGVSQLLLDAHGITLDEYLDLGVFNDIGGARGGRAKIGGLYWCDWFEEFEPIPGTPQVVGHTGRRPDEVNKGVLEREGSFNVDCFEHVEEFLLLADTGPKIIEIGED